MARVGENSTFLRPWLNAILTALSTSAVSIETLGTSPLECGKLKAAQPRFDVERSNYYRIGYGDRIDALSQNPHHESGPFKGQWAGRLITY